MLTGVAALGLTLALVRSDLSLRYVAEHTTTNLPTLYKAAALLAGDAGRRLAFALTLSACAASAMIPLARSRAGWSTTALALMLLAVLAWSTLGAPPFERLPWQVADGRGLDPRLQNPLLFVREPVLLVGYALTLVAAAHALDADQRARLSRWIIPAWLAQLVAFSLGSRQWPALAAWLSTTLLLMPTSLRREWWPAKRRGAHLLTVTIITAGGLFAIGAIAARMAKPYTVTLGQGESTKVRDAYGREWTFTQQGVSAFREENREVTAITLEATRNTRGIILVTERRQPVDSRGEETAEPLVVAGRKHGLDQEVAVTLLRTLPDDAAELRVDFRPLKSLQTAAYLLLFAAGVAAWAGALRRRT